MPGKWTGGQKSLEDHSPRGCKELDTTKGLTLTIRLLFNFYAEYIMRNPGLEEAQAGIKIGRRNINNLRYADDTTLMAESEEELKSLLVKSERGE